MKSYFLTTLAVLMVLTPALAYAQDGTGSVPASGGSAQPAAVATSAPATLAATPAATVATTSGAAPRPATPVAAPRAAPQPVQIQLATVTTDIVVPAASSTSPLPVAAAVIAALAGIIGGTFLALRGKFSKQDTNDKKCDDIRTLLEQKKKELEEFVKEWPEEKLKEEALARGAAMLEENETFAPAVETALKVKEEYDKLQEAIETLTKRYDLCMLSLPPTPNPNIEVRDSKIEGKGVFALRDFTKGERIVEWGERKVLADEEYAKLSDDFKRRYVSTKDGKRLLSGEPMRYVNHSCDANTSPTNGADVALRDIAEGEEITSDYSNFGQEGLACNCGAEGCKGKL